MTKKNDLPEPSRPKCHDAIVVVPGIMGSELVETETETVLWGLAPSQYVRLWTGDSQWERLKVTAEERLGQGGRIKPTRLLTAPAFAPLLRGAEPCSRLISGIRNVVVHRDAILEFPYDWRLTVAYNAGKLACAAEAHLRQWRAHPHGHPDARLVLIAHSMGGLVARYFAGFLDGNNLVTQIICIGTPFQGAVKALLILSHGGDGSLPLPRRRMRELAKTMPGVHDLLPSYRCLDESGQHRRLTSLDVQSLGGDLELARAGLKLHDSIGQLQVSRLRTIVGVEQPTLQSVRLRDGIAEPQYFTLDDDEHIDWRGDGTVHAQVATGGVEPISSLPQSHGALARTPESVAAICAALTRRRLGPPMGAPSAGLDAPEWAVVDQPFEISITTKPGWRGGHCRIIDAESELQVSKLIFTRHSDRMVAAGRLARPGLYRIEVRDGANSAIEQAMIVYPTAA